MHYCTCNHTHNCTHSRHIYDKYGYEYGYKYSCDVMIPYTRLILNLVLSSTFFIEEKLTINYNLSNGLSLLSLCVVLIIASIVNLDLQTCPELVLSPDTNSKHANLHISRIIFF